MTTLAALRAVFAAHRRAWSKDELVTETGKPLSSVSPALLALLEEGSILLTAGKYRPSEVGIRAFGQGHNKHLDHDKQRALVKAQLPATMRELEDRTGRSASYLHRLLKELGAVADVGWRYHLGDVKSPKRHPGATLRTAADEYACVESSSTSWLETEPTSEGFNCERRRIFVTFATCYDDHTTAASRQRGHVGVCRTCPKGQQLRAEYAQGS
jgi:hypothetical protein